MSNKSDKFLDLGHALLALKTRAPDPVPDDQVPSDDDLLALYEGEPGDEKRAAVMHALANHPDTYSRWLALVEASFTVEQDVHAAPPVPAETDQPPSIFMRWLRPLFLPGLTAAAALAVVFMLLPIGTSLENNIDGLYRDYSFNARIITGGSSTLPARSIGRDQTAEQARFYQPINLGLAHALGIEAPAVDDPDSLRDDEHAALFALGRLSAISYAQCKDPAAANDDAFFQDAMPVLATITQSLTDEYRRELRLTGHINDVNSYCIMMVRLIDSLGVQP